MTRSNLGTFCACLVAVVAALSFMPDQPKKAVAEAREVEPLKIVQAKTPDVSVDIVAPANLIEQVDLVPNEPVKIPEVSKQVKATAPCACGDSCPCPCPRTTTTVAAAPTTGRVISETIVAINGVPLANPVVVKGAGQSAANFLAATATAQPTHVVRQAPFGRLWIVPNRLSTTQCNVAQPFATKVSSVLVQQPQQSAVKSSTQVQVRSSNAYSRPPLTIESPCSNGRCSRRW